MFHIHNNIYLQMQQAGSGLYVSENHTFDFTSKPNKWGKRKKKIHNIANNKTLYCAVAMEINVYSVIVITSRETFAMVNIALCFLFGSHTMCGWQKQSLLCLCVLLL